MPVARTRDACKAAIDGDAMTESANALAAHSGDAFEERDADRQIAAFVEQAAQRRRWLNGDTFADMKAGFAADRIQPHRHARRNIPHRIMRNRRGQRGKRARTNDASEEDAGPYHDDSLLRWSQARWRVGE